MSVHTERTYRWLLWLLVIVGTGLDQSSKYVVFRWLYNQGDRGQCIVVPGAFKLLAEFTDRREPASTTLASLRNWSGERLPRVNQGALFGIRLGLSDGEGWLANTVFAVVSLVAAAAIAYWSSRPAAARDLWLCSALGLILAGTLGNLYDRLVFNGVRDFLYFHLIEWPVFNVADCCLVCGAFLLLLQAFLTRPVMATSQQRELALSAASAEGE